MTTVQTNLQGKEEVCHGNEELKVWLFSYLVLPFFLFFLPPFMDGYHMQSKEKEENITHFWFSF